MATRFDDWEGQYLEHFGTKGMKWGQRRYQNEDGSLTAAGRTHYGVGGERSARGVSRDLRRLEKERAGAQARADYYKGKVSKKLAKLENKKASNLAKGKSVEKQKAKINKINEGVGKKASDYQKLAQRSKALSDKIIKESLKKGYSINSRDTMRFVRKGRDKALFLIGRKGTSVVSVKYHVHNNGLGVRTHKKSIGMINRARHRSNFL